ncbi:MAG: FAD-dependent oxidoreductase [Geminicoccaceae bacterium]
MLLLEQGPTGDFRLDLARRRAGRAAAHQRQHHPIARLLGRDIVYGRLPRPSPGQATGWKRNGGLRLACTPDRWTEVRRQATTARSFGLEMQLLSAREAPILAADGGGRRGGCRVPADRRAGQSRRHHPGPGQGRAHGRGDVARGVAVTGFELQLGRVRAVHTTAGTVACDKVVLCAGQWTRALAAMAGVNVPLVSVQHQYLVTEPIAGVTPGLPTLRDPDRLTYYKEEVGGLVMGGYEPNPKPWAERGLPERFEFQLLGEDWDHFEPIMELALGRVPALREAGIKQLINGPESFTPDGNWIIGEAPETRGIFVGAGFNAFGIASAGGAGMALAEWVAEGEPPFDVWPVDIRRFGRNHMDTDWIRTRTLEAYGRHYALAWPHEEHHAGRPCAARRCGSGCRIRGRASARSWAGSGPTGSPGRASSRSTA